MFNCAHPTSVPMAGKRQRDRRGRACLKGCRQHTDTGAVLQDRVHPLTKPRFSSYFTQWKPSLSLGQTGFVPGTSRWRMAAEKVYVPNVYVPFLAPKDSRVPGRGASSQAREKSTKMSFLVWGSSTRRGGSPCRKRGRQKGIGKKVTKSVKKGDRMATKR